MYIFVYTALMPTSRSTTDHPEPGADLRARVLRAAAQTFAKDGYERTRMTNVANVAGVSRASLYKHFSTKADLLRALNESVISEWRVWLQASVAVAPTVREAIDRWLREGLTENARIDAIRVLTAEDAQGDLLLDHGATQRALDETRQVLSLVLRRGIETGEVRPEIDVEATASALQSLLLGLQRNRATERPIASLAGGRDVEALIELVLGGLLATS